MLKDAWWTEPRVKNPNQWTPTMDSNPGIMSLHGWYYGSTRVVLGWSVVHLDDSLAPDDLKNLPAPLGSIRQGQVHNLSISGELD